VENSKTISTFSFLNAIPERASKGTINLTRKNGDDIYKVIGVITLF
jgi:hypothetical protein